MRRLNWAHGSLTVQRLGAMLAPVRFDLPDGRSVAPLHIAPWTDEPLPPGLPGILQRLRGEWPCIPFGADEPENLSPAWQASIGRPSRLPSGAPPHGESSNHQWQWLDSGDECLALRLDYPKDHPIDWVERILVADPEGPNVTCVLKVMPRADCLLPIALHPTFALPSEAGMARIVPPRAAQIRSYPGSLEPGADIFEPDCVFQDLKDAPGVTGQRVDATRLPFEAPGEDLLQLAGVATGCVFLENHVDDYRVSVRWNAEHFPSLLIWYSNHGRRNAPWNGRHLALGLEPICSAFDLGDGVSCGPNPISVSGVATAHRFTAAQLFETSLHIGMA